MEPIPYAQTDSELRKFGLIMAGMVVLMFALVLPWLFSFDMPYWPFILAAVLIVLALLKPDPLQNKFSDEESYRVKSTPRDKQHLEKPF